MRRTNPGATVATGYVDPCIVYLETTAPGEVPLLGACWSASSREVRDAAGKSHWELKEVVLTRGVCLPGIRSRKARWIFTTQWSELLILKHDEKDALLTDSPFFVYRFASPIISVRQWSFRFLDRRIDSSMRETVAMRPGQSNMIAKMLLEQSKLKWPSISEGLASLQPPQPRPRRPSFMRRFLSSVLGKKKQPVQA